MLSSERVQQSPETPGPRSSDKYGCCHPEEPERRLLWKVQFIISLLLPVIIQVQISLHTTVSSHSWLVK